MNRRGFLRVFSVVTGATVLPTVMGQSVLAATTSDPTKKYRDCLEIVDRCRGETTCTGASAVFDELCRYVRANFAAPDYSKLQNNANATILKKILRGNDFDENDLRQVPPVIIDELYIISLAKLLVHYYKAPIDPGHSEEFGWFHGTYSRFILDPIC